MRRTLLAATILCAIATQAHAQGGGYSYNCAVNCVGADAWFTIPNTTYNSGIGGQQQVVTWIGIQGPSNGLLQFGILQLWPNSSGPNAPLAWWELTPATLRTISTSYFAPQVGDIVHLILTCTAGSINCAPLHSGQEWTMTIVDYPISGGSPITCNIHAISSPDCTGGNYSPSSSIDNVSALFVAEMNGPAGSPNFTPLRWSGMRVDSGSGLTPIVVTSYSQVQGAHTLSGANEQCSQGSWAVSNAGFACWSLCTNGNAPLCPALIYSGPHPSYGP